MPKLDVSPMLMSLFFSKVARTHTPSPQAGEVAPSVIRGTALVRNFSLATVTITSLWVTTPLFISQAFANPLAVGAEQSLVDRLALALQKDLPAGSFDLTIEESHGRVLLKGSVASESVQREVKSIAEATTGVREVMTSVVLDPTLKNESTNTALSAAIIEELSNQLPAQAHSLKISALGSKVVLQGEVAREESIQTILTIVRQVPGVTLVENRLRVTLPIPDETVLVGVERKLKSHPRYAEVAGKVNDGVVTLNGDVASFREVDSLLTSMLMLPGVKSVDSQVTVAGKEYPKALQR